MRAHVDFFFLHFPPSFFGFGFWVLSCNFFPFFFAWFGTVLVPGAQPMQPGPGAHDEMGHATSLMHSGRGSVGHTLGG